MKTKKSNKNKILASIGIAAIICGVHSILFKSDQAIRSQVVKLQSAHGSCSGVQIKAPSGVSYILSAGHCSGIATEGQNIEVVTEDGKILSRKVIKEDPIADLLLIEGLPADKGLSIAKELERGDSIRTFTRGLGMPTYQTSGKVIGKSIVRAITGMLDTAKDEKACAAMPKNRVENFLFGKVCVLTVEETAVTAVIVPGSSGGAVVDAYGDLVGIASAGGDGLYYIVKLTDIRAFISNY